VQALYPCEGSICARRIRMGPAVSAWCGKDVSRHRPTGVSRVVVPALTPASDIAVTASRAGAHVIRRGARARRIAPDMRPRSIIALALATIALTVSFALARSPAPPEVRFTTLSGESFRLSDLRGNVVLVAFWATYCKECLREMPRMAEMHRRLAPRGFETVAVAVRQDSPARVAEIASGQALPFKVAIDSSGEAGRRFGNVRITPTLFLIDRDGQVVKRYVREPDWREVERAL
jgi:peroxiredoxin